ncbi:MAG: hypothetical protein ACI8PZ_005653 [Myxococcota bacterium]|jgi:hypothetical protein
MHRLVVVVLAGAPSVALAAPMLSGDVEVSASWSLVVEDVEPPFAPG